MVVIETDSGLEGCGESCPIRGNCLAAHAEGILAAAPRLAGAIIGTDPLRTGAAEQAMDETVAELESHRRSGYRQFRFKVGDDPEGDFERIRAGAGLLEPGEMAFANADTG